MKDYFNGRSYQVEYDGSLTAFGIKLSSRYQFAGEIVEMLEFSTAIALKGLHIYIEEVFYDSKANLCSFVFTSALERFSDEELTINEAAKETISQFELGGTVYQGKPLLEAMREF